MCCSSKRSHRFFRRLITGFTLKTKLTDGIFSTAFKKKGIFEFGEACEWVRQSPYKRNTETGDQINVINEGCGTCSSKHELIKRLADECELKDCCLVLCMFKMTSENTPKVRTVLELYGLQYIPEAHTYISINGEVNDFTFPENPELVYQKDILYTEVISADQIKTYKSATHREYLKKWLEREQIPFSFQEIWEVREACIAALSVT